MSTPSFVFVALTQGITLVDDLVLPGGTTFVGSGESIDVGLALETDSSGNTFTSQYQGGTKPDESIITIPRGTVLTVPCIASTIALNQPSSDPTLPPFTMSAASLAQFSPSTSATVLSTSLVIPAGIPLQNILTLPSATMITVPKGYPGKTTAGQLFNALTGFDLDNSFVFPVMPYVTFPAGYIFQYSLSIPDGTPVPANIASQSIWPYHSYSRESQIAAIVFSVIILLILLFVLYEYSHTKGKK